MTFATLERDKQGHLTEHGQVQLINWSVANGIVDPTEAGEAS